MAYDRYDTGRDRDRWRGFDNDRDRWRSFDNDRDRWQGSEHDRGRRDERGFFERAGDEIASWFGDDRSDGDRDRERGRMNRGFDRERGDDRYMYGGWGGETDRGRFAYRGQGDFRDFRERGRSDENRDFGRGGTIFGGAFTGSDYDRPSSGRDRHYHSWRQRQIDELDRDYDEFRRENQQKFESDFGSWRETRQQQRGRLGQVREHMDVVGSDGQSIGKVDCVRGDHIVLTKADSDDNRHHAVKCSMVETIEGDEVRLTIPAEEARSRWEELEGRSFSPRGEDETSLERSFSGTYR